MSLKEVGLDINDQFYKTKMRSIWENIMLQNTSKSRLLKKHYDPEGIGTKIKYKSVCLLIVINSEYEEHILRIYHANKDYMNEIEILDEIFREMEDRRQEAYLEKQPLEEVIDLTQEEYLALGKTDLLDNIENQIRYLLEMEPDSYRKSKMKSLLSQLPFLKKPLTLDGLFFRGLAYLESES